MNKLLQRMTDFSSPDSTRKRATSQEEDHKRASTRGTYTVWTTFVPEVFESALMVAAMPGGILVLVWNILVARRLFQFARPTNAPV